MRNSILGPPPTPAVDHPILKEGKLFKQRDVFKGWRERYFVLQGSFLLYYLEADDPMPRKSMLVTGCTITDAKPSMVGQQVFYTFTLSHPKHPETYRLSSSSMETANEWVSALKAVAAEDSESILMENPMRQSEKLIPNSSQKKVFSTPMKETKENIPCSIKSNAEDNPVTNIATTETKPEDEYVAGLGGEEAEKIRKAVSTLLEVTGPNASGWEEMFEKNGVNAYKKAGSGAVCVRGDTIIPYHPFDVFRLLLDINRQSELDPQKVVSKKVKQLNQYTSYQYLKFKQVSLNFLAIKHDI